MGIGALNNGLHGRPITVTVVTPTAPIYVHHVYDIGGGRSKTFEVYLAISNTEATAGVVEVSYNGGITEVTVPAHDTKMYFLTVRGADAAFAPAGQASVGVRWATTYSGTLYVTGGWRDS